jgi:hypothetical protein
MWLWSLRIFEKNTEMQHLFRKAPGDSIGPKVSAFPRGKACGSDVAKPNCSYYFKGVRSAWSVFQSEFHCGICGNSPCLNVAGVRLLNVQEEL